MVPVPVLFVPEVVEQQLADDRRFRPRVHRAEIPGERLLERVELARELLQFRHW